eukprot:scaffold8.g1501.t1
MGRSRSRSRERRKRSRSRSRERRRGRSRSRSRGRREDDRGRREDGRARFLVTDEQNVAAQMQQQQLQALQQQQLQNQLLAQQLMMASAGQVMAATAMPAALAAMPQAAPSAAASATADRKAREIYIGNLAIGIITQELLAEFFNQARGCRCVFASMVPDPTAQPPVVHINMDSTGRFAFVEFRYEEMVDKAVQMDKIVELGGRVMNIGRPKGYVPPPPGQPRLGAPAPALSAVVAQQQSGPPPTTALLLAGLLPAGQLRKAEDRRIEARKAQPVFDGRTLDGNTIKATFVSEDEFARAAHGEWVSKQAGVAGIPLPGLYNLIPLQSGISGLTALNPALAALVATNPGIAAMMTAGINADEVPFEQGWVKLRGFMRTTTKRDVIDFLKGCGELTEEDVKLVLSADGTPLGEAFVHFRSPSSKVRLALAKDRSAMPGTGAAVEVLTAVEEDGQRRMLSGCMLV